MTKEQAKKMLCEQFEKHNDLTEDDGISIDERVTLVDGMLKIYTILCESNGFDKEKPTESTANLGS